MTGEPVDIKFQCRGDYYQVFALTEAGKKLVNKAEFVHRDKVELWKIEAIKLKLKILVVE